MREPREGDRLRCPACRHSEPVSVEDPDASLSEVWHHIRWTHAVSDAETRSLLGQVWIVDAAGRIVE